MVVTFVVDLFNRAFLVDSWLMRKQKINPKKRSAGLLSAGFIGTQLAAAAFRCRGEKEGTKKRTYRNKSKNPQ